MHCFHGWAFPSTSTLHPPDVIHVMNAPRPSLFFCHSSTIHVLSSFMPSPCTRASWREGGIWGRDYELLQPQTVDKTGKAWEEASWVALSPTAIWYDTWCLWAFLHLHFATGTCMHFTSFQQVNCDLNVCRNCCTNSNWTKVKKCLKHLEMSAILELSLQNKSFLWTGFVAFDIGYEDLMLWGEFEKICHWESKTQCPWLELPVLCQRPWGFPMLFTFTS